jgi:hypothetical protein
VVFEYCYLNSSGNIDSRSIQINLEFGTGTDALEYLKDPETGKPKKFNSVVDALNDMGKKGWGINLSGLRFRQDRVLAVVFTCRIIAIFLKDDAGRRPNTTAKKNPVTFRNRVIFKLLLLGLNQGPPD